MRLKPKYKFVEEQIQRIQESTIEQYGRDWKLLLPKTTKDYYDRWLFAFLSVRTGWSQNVKAFRMLSSLGLNFNRNSLKRTLLDSRIGLYKNRNKGIYKFKTDFLLAYEWFRWQPHMETILQCRDRLEKRFHGIGLAKTSFGLEMLYPFNCEVVCLDTHMFKLYGIKGKNKSIYKDIEGHWVDSCNKTGYPSALVRNIIWDRNQGFKDSFYWANCFRKPQCQIKISN